MDTGEQPPVNDSHESGPGNRRTLVLLGTVIAAVLVVGLIAWIVIDRSGNDSATAGPAGVTDRVGPVTASQDALSGLAADVGHPVSWAGPIAGQTVEFTKTTTGRVYVRYLPAGVEAGDKRADFLIVATYPFPDAYGALEKVGKGAAVKIPGGGIAVVAEGHPQSVHFAFPKVGYQGEIYDPSPEKALAVATSGTIQPVP